MLLELNESSSGDIFDTKPFVPKCPVTQEEKMRIVPFLGLLLGQSAGQNQGNFQLFEILVWARDPDQNFLQ